MKSQKKPKPRIERWSPRKKKSESWKDENGRHHREGEPAFTAWYKSGRPATTQYFCHGKRHNPNGPAIFWWKRDGTPTAIERWIWGVNLEKEEIQEWMKEHNVDNLYFSDWPVEIQSLFWVTYG